MRSRDMTHYSTVRGALARIFSDCRERLLKIRNQIIDVLDTDG